MFFLGKLRSGIGAYALAAVCALAAAALQWALQPALGSRIPFLFFLPLLAAIAATLGTGPALLVLLAGALQGTLWMVPVGRLELASAPDRISLAAYFLVGAVVVLWGSRVRVIGRRAAEAEQRMTLAQNDTGVGLFEIDLVSQTVFATPAMRRLLGFAPAGDSLTLERWVSMLPPDEIDNSRAALKQALQAGSDRYEREHRVVLHDGSGRWLLTRVQVETDAGGRPQRLRGVSVDITQRKALEAMLRQARDDLTLQVADLQRLHELSSALPELSTLQAQLQAILTALCEFHGTRQGLVWVTDPDSGRLTVMASLGFGARGVEGLSAVPPGTGPASLARAQGRRVVIEDTEQDPSYAQMHALARQEGFRAVHSTPLLALSGAVIGAISVQFTQPRRPTEREMRLADICARKAAVFIERARAQEALQAADRRKDEFLATLAHELRNPLAPIRQAAAISKAPAATEAQKRWSHEVIDRQVHQMALLLDDLLDVSRITRGMLRLRPGPTELKALIDAAVETARPLIDARRHELVVELPAEPLRLQVDAMRVAQVVANLLANAAKYTDPGGRIRVVAERTGDELQLRVSDNGIGLRAEALSEIFEMFTQVRSAEDRSAGGLGIGLALAKGLVALHGGRIWAQSPGPGQGSTFTLSLPLGHDAVAAEAPSVTPPGAERARRRVLVADDNHDAAESLAELLRLNGHEVTVAFDGEAALAEFRRFQPEVALLDIGMPKLDGNAVAGAIRRSPSGRHTMLVAITGWGQEKDRSEALAAGFDHHLTKPVDPERVHVLLTNLASQAAAGLAGP
jgi:PAS domain S-box-containing protein